MKKYSKDIKEDLVYGLVVGLIGGLIGGLVFGLVFGLGIVVFTQLIALIQSNPEFVMFDFVIICKNK